MLLLVLLNYKIIPAFLKKLEFQKTLFPQNLDTFRQQNLSCSSSELSVVPNSAALSSTTHSDPPHRPARVAQSNN